MKLKCVEFCTGIGGLAYGFHLTNKFKHILLIDNNKDCCDTLKLNKFNNVKLCDINTIQKQIPLADIFCIGSPCQSFSTIGKKKGLFDKRGNVLIKFIEILIYNKPKMFLIENVVGLKSINNGDTFKYIINKLKKIGYNVCYKILDSSNYGVPQKRNRLFIFGSMYNDKFKFPDHIRKKNKLVLQDVLYDIEDNEITAKYSEKKLKYVKKIPPNGCWVCLSIDEQKEYMGKCYYSSGGRRGVLKRLSNDKPCLTLLCSPNQKQTDRIHPLYDRPLTIKEYMRIQTFPDNYIICGSITNKYKYIGNAIPINLSKILGECIYDYYITIRN